MISHTIKEGTTYEDKSSDSNHIVASEIDKVLVHFSSYLLKVFLDDSSPTSDYILIIS